MPETAAHGQPDWAAAAWKLRGEQQPANVHQSSMMHRPSLKVTCHVEMMSMPNSAVIFVPVSKMARKPRSGPSRPLGRDCHVQLDQAVSDPDLECRQRQEIR